MVHLDRAKEITITFFLSGTISMTTKTLVAPMERTKMILQNQGSAYQVLTGERKPYNGVLDVLRRIPKEQGYLAFWRGNGVNLIRTFPTMAFNFAFNDIYNNISNLFYDTKKYFAFSKLSCGGLAGFTTGTLLYPLEFCQTKLASDFGSDPHFVKDRVQREYSGLSNCIYKVYHREGFLGYYKGWIVECQGIFWYRGLYFGLHALSKDRYLKWSNIKDGKVPFLPNFLLAMMTTVTAGCAAYPFDTVGRRLMLDSAREKEYKLFNNSRDAVRKLYKQGGIRIFYKGALVNSVRSVSSALVLSLYDLILDATDWKNKIKK
ncbi:ADP/ATP translocase 1 isoform X2 [Aethina tumida]|uniref:ADP/ATP translocase 1 isoform X2 n=1 Tax=Aethina tumida TaxID=116153 RepID=UPI00096AE21B|nr:ADP/ATP translocase 1 isoform X2 [Aethina tumida]